MPFSWYHPDVPGTYASAGQKARHMYIRELKERAALLLRLGYSAEDARLRLRANVSWDFELHAVPDHLSLVDEVVAEVYKHRGMGSGGPPSLEP